MSSTITVSKEAINDLVRIKDEFDTVIESLELMSNKVFMDSYKRSREQIRKRELKNWDDLLI